GALAAGEDAAAVAQDQGAADRGGDGAGGPPDVQRLGGAGQDGGDDRRVAGQAARGAWAERGPAVDAGQGGGGQVGAQVGEVEGDHDGRHRPAGGRLGVGGQGDQVGEGVGAP